MSFKKIRVFLIERCPKTAVIFFAFAAFALIMNVLFVLFEEFSDFFNRYIGSFIRGVMAMISGIFPFSIAEILILSLPVSVIAVFVIGIRRTGRSSVEGGRFVFGLASVLALLYSMFVITSTAGYNGTSLSDKLGLPEEPISIAELKDSAYYMVEKMNGELSEIEYKYGGSSVMPYSTEELNTLILKAYGDVSQKYPFIPTFWSRIKPIALSEAMSYTHITGIYTYYTGEANLNINFPDYCLPFTAAHELAHQRGIMPEDEANFVAFLVCSESDDPYIRYSGYLNMFEYLNSALYSADYQAYAEVQSSLDMRVRYEMLSYGKFFEKYSENTAANISSALNDTYLKIQGEEKGEKSYGMVVDLAAAYVKYIQE